MLAEHLVLRGEEPLDGAHQRAAFAGEVRDGLALDGRLEEVARADADAQCQRLFRGAAADVLVDGVGGVDPPALGEEGAQRRARALRGNEHHVDIFRGHDARAVAPRDGEAV